MRKVLCTVAFVAALSGAAWAEDGDKLLASYLRNFAISSLDTKIQILQDAATGGYAGLGPLYTKALDFVLDNGSLLESEDRMKRLATLAIGQIKRTAYDKDHDRLWQLFDITTDVPLRLQVLDALGSVAAGDATTLARLNAFLDGQNALLKTGKVPDTRLVTAAVDALGMLGDASSFPILFSAMTGGYSAEVTAKARDALYSVKGDLKDNLIGIMKTRPLADKRSALELALGSTKLDDAAKAGIAEYALDVGLHTSVRDALEKQTAREIRYVAARLLSEKGWSSASALALEHFDLVQSEYERGLATKKQLTDAMDFLGNMKSDEAASRLTLYLVLVNSSTEQGKGYDEDVVLALIRNLKKLGDSVAFDDLIYVQYLTYSDAVRKSAREAVETLSH
jgi:hypothetical protein